MMTIHELYERAKSEGIEIYDYEFDEIRAIALPSNKIGIDKRKFDSDAELKCDLAHEIGHVETGSFYNYYSPYDVWEKCEHKANKRAAEILMPLDEVRIALRRGYRTAWALAGLFDVTIEFAEMALGMYEGALINDQEQQQLEEVLARVKVVNDYKPMPKLMKARDLMKPKADIDNWGNDIYLKMDLL